MSNSVNVLCDDVLKRLSKILKTSSDEGLAKELGVAKNTISSWRTRNKIPFEQVVEISLNQKVSLDFLVLGGRSLVLDESKLVDLKMVSNSLLEYIWLGLDEELFLTEKLPNAEVFKLLSKVYNNTIIEIPNSVSFDDPIVEKIADKEIKEMIDTYQSFMGLSTNKKENEGSFQSTQNFNAPVGQASGRDIVNHGKGDK